MILSGWSGVVSLSSMALCSCLPSSSLPLPLLLLSSAVLSSCLMEQSMHKAQVNRARDGGGGITPAPPINAAAGFILNRHRLPQESRSSCQLSSQHIRHLCHIRVDRSSEVMIPYSPADTADPHACRAGGGGANTRPDFPQIRLE